VCPLLQHSLPRSKLPLEAMIAQELFVGINPNREHHIYPLGCNIILKSLTKKKQVFMQGHINNVSCVTVSKGGKYVASWSGPLHGLQEEYMLTCSSTKPKWKDWPSPLNVKYLVTLGGQDDGRFSICGSPASAHSGGQCLTLDTLRVWELDLPHKIRSTECQTGQLKTIVKCIWEGSYFYCGTSGDILKVNLKTKLLNGLWPSETGFQQGGSAGEGVTSIEPSGEGHQFFVGTEATQIYCFNYTDFKEDGSSELFATCAIFNSDERKTILSVTHSFVFLPVIDFLCCFLSAWNDGKIRGFTPETGRLMMTVHNAHSMGVSDSYRHHPRLQEDCQWGGKGQKQQILYTLVRSVCYHPDEYQIITSDRQEGTSTTTFALRELEGSLSGSINGIHITIDGDYFVTDTDACGGYSEGEVTDIGTGHSGSINSVKICSNNKYVISISVDGSILPWRYPHLPYYPGQNSPHPDSL
uniref:Cilia- and flagella-associated protein 52 n=1 Tax=Hucho hucho TaxID=62062 RepID=A0A4W5Q0C8_9TELE